jgi:death on curing protein
VRGREPIRYLAADQILWFHEQALRFGGAPGLRSQHVLLSALGQPGQSAFGEDAYSSVPEKAAAYGFFLVENHPFIDGNKRTAAIAMLVFLDLNGFELIQGDDEIAEMLERLAGGRADQREFFAWVRKHAVARRQGG